MSKKPRKEEDRNKEQFVDDSGEVIENINEFLNQPDEELMDKVDTELKDSAIIEAYTKFMCKVKKYRYIGIGSKLSYENLYEFVDWIIEKRISI